MQPGDVVVHRRYGRGTVQALIAGGRATVRFERAPSLPRTVPLIELSNDGAVPPKPRIAPVRLPEATARVDRETAELRQVIEALRLGTVPSFHLKEYTVGRQHQFRRVQEVLAQGQGMELVFGDYGAGKTHFLDLVEQEALSQQFVTSRVVLHPEETPLSHPQRLWQAIAASLRYPDQTQSGIVPLFERLRSSRAHSRPEGTRAHRFLSPALWAFCSDSADAWGWLQDYIEGYPMDGREVNRVLRSIGWRGPNALALSDFRTYGRVYAYVVGGLAGWAHDAGFRGLCLLFDEAEQVAGFDTRHRDLAEEVICHYAAAALPQQDLLFDPEHLYRGGHEVHRSLPLRFDEEQPLIVLLALTQEPTMTAMADQLIAGHRIELTPLSPRDLKELVERLRTLYQRAYPGSTLPDDPLPHPPSWYETPRELVRALIAAFDAHRYGM